MGFLDGLVGKPRSTVNDSSTEIANEKLPAESKAIESWLKKLYDQFVAEKAGRANLEGKLKAKSEWLLHRSLLVTLQSSLFAAFP